MKWRNCKEKETSVESQMKDDEQTDLVEPTIAGRCGPELDDSNTNSSSSSVNNSSIMWRRAGESVDTNKKPCGERDSELLIVDDHTLDID